MKRGKTSVWQGRGEDDILESGGKTAVGERGGGGDGSLFGEEGVRPLFD